MQFINTSNSGSIRLTIPTQGHQQGYTGSYNQIPPDQGDNFYQAANGQQSQYPGVSIWSLNQNRA